MPDTENTSLDDLLQKWEKAKANRSERTKRAARRAALAAIPLAVIFLLVPFIDRELLYSSKLMTLFLGLVFLPIISFLVNIFDPMFSMNDWRLLAEIATHEDDKRILPVMLSSMSELGGNALPLPVLPKLLQLVEAEDAEMLRENQREIWAFVRQDVYLNEAMTYDEMRVVKFAAVHALGKVGGYDVLGDVERFATRLAREKTDDSLLEAIQEVLPAIRQRTAEAQTAQTLLRASDGKRDDTTLLRAASDTNEGQKDQLLRATTQENASDG